MGGAGDVGLSDSLATERRTRRASAIFLARALGLDGSRTMHVCGGGGGKETRAWHM